MNKDLARVGFDFCFKIMFGGQNETGMFFCKPLFSFGRFWKDLGRFGEGLGRFGSCLGKGQETVWEKCGEKIIFGVTFFRSHFDFKLFYPNC